MKSSKLLYFVSIEWNNLDVIKFFLGGINYSAQQKQNARA